MALQAQMQPWPLALNKSPLGPYTKLHTLQVQRPKIGLALSGGGARGLAQIGVLQVLEQHAIPLDCITGTSIGAIVGGLYAMGYTATEIESLTVAFHWDSIIRRDPPRQQLFLTQKSNAARHLLELHFQDMHLVLPSAFSSGQALTTMLTDLVYSAPFPPLDNFDQMHIPFRAIATDLVNGEKVVLRSGSLVDAMRASMAIPLLFSPITLGGRQLVDGGLVDNLPSEEAIAMGADRVLAVDTSSPLHRADALKAPWVVADQVSTIMMINQLNQSKAGADLLITPALQGVTNLDFNNIQEIIQAGRDAAMQVVDTVDKWLLADMDSCVFHTPIHQLDLHGLLRLHRQEICEILGANRLPMPSEDLALGIKRLAGDGRILSISASLDTSSGHCALLLTEAPHVSALSFSGNTQFDDSTLCDLMQMPLPLVLNTRHLKAKLNRIVSHYKQHSFSMARIDTCFIDAEETLHVGISEGQISRIDLIGIHHTKPWVVYRELPFARGDLIKASAISSALTHIYSTGYFEEVRVATYPNALGGEHLFIFLDEKSQGSLRLGLRYDVNRKMTGFAEIAQDNLLGLGVQGSMRALAGHLDQRLSLNLNSNRLMYSYLTADLSFETAEHREFLYEDLKKTGDYTASIRSACFSLGQQMGRLGTVSIRFGAENIEILSSSNNNIRHETLDIFSLGIRSEVDTRDRTPFTMRGMHHLLDYETAADWIGNKDGYTRLESLIETYYSTARFWTLHPRLHWGSSDLTTPFFKQFKIGGLESMPIIPREAITGRRFVALAAELRCNLPWPEWLSPHLSIRFDIAGAWKHYDAIKAEDFHRGMSLLFGADTYLGPLFFTYGRMHNGGTHLFFSWGHRFSLK